MRCNDIYLDLIVFFLDPTSHSSLLPPPSISLFRSSYFPFLKFFCPRDFRSQLKLSSYRLPLLLSPFFSPVSCLLSAYILAMSYIYSPVATCSCAYVIPICSLPLTYASHDFHTFLVSFHLYLHTITLPPLLSLFHPSTLLGPFHFL